MSACLGRADSLHVIESESRIYQRSFSKLLYEQVYRLDACRYCWDLLPESVVTEILVPSYYLRCLVEQPLSPDVGKIIRVRAADSFYAYRRVRDIGKLVCKILHLHSGMPAEIFGSCAGIGGDAINHSAAEKFLDNSGIRSVGKYVH